MAVDLSDTLLSYLIIGVIFGGRLGYVLFYNLPYYVDNPIEIFQIWDGGMAFHGGFIGVVLAYILFARLHSVPFWSGADLVAIATPPGIFLGRVANFINAELWGKPTSLPWGVIFPGARAQDCPGYSSPCARHPSQLYEAFLEGLILLIILVLVAYFGGLKKTKLVAGIFIFGYGISRYIVEFFRVPDPQFFSEINPYGFAFQLGNFGFTMGQTLSIPLICFGFLLIYLSFLSDPKWGKG